MSSSTDPLNLRRRVGSLTRCVPVLAAMALGGCASSNGAFEAELPATALSAAAPPPSVASAGTAPQTSDLDGAIAQARALAAQGDKRQAQAALDQMAAQHAGDRAAASRLGRLALDLDRLDLARRLLAVADDPAAPDWRVLSARGVLLAREGEPAGAIASLERAAALAPNEPAVINNLALAHAMAGDAGRAEALLRQLDGMGAATPTKVRQNLALVVGLQGRFDEAGRIAGADIGPDAVAANTRLLRQMVGGAPPRADGTAGGRTATAGRWQPTVVRTAQATGPATPQAASLATPAATTVTREPLPPLRGSTVP